MKESTLQERYELWKQHCDFLAKEMGLEIEFVTHDLGHGYMTYEVPTVEVSSSRSPFGYYGKEGTTSFGY